MSDKKNKRTEPITTKKDVEESKDPKIDQDVPGFPHHPSSNDDLKKKDPASKAHAGKSEKEK